MIKIGITGGIGAGKTTATDYLKSRGYTVVDADEISREITSSGGKAIPYIVSKFGSEFVLPDGSMDRAKMRDLVFNNPEAKTILENGTTKVVIEDIKQIIIDREKAGDKVVFFSIPQLFENNMENEYDEIWAVSADREIKKKRIKSRDNIDDNIIDLIISIQAEEEYINSKSDVIIFNNGSVKDLHAHIDKLLDKLK